MKHPIKALACVLAILFGIGLAVVPADAHDPHSLATSQKPAQATPPANDAGKVFTTTLDGKLIYTLNTPTSADEFDNPVVNDYFFGGGNFAPTDVEYLDGLYYVTTGYSELDFVLTARVLSLSPFKAIWNDLVFGGKGDGPGQFGTAHGITVPPGKKRLDISDRPHPRPERVTRYGH